jgi:ATP-binding cassette subfamily C (CFTR/MRP) protein 10
VPPQPPPTAPPLPQSQVRYAFLAGLAVSLLLIPVNRLIATRIQAASADMMRHKDERVR